MSDLYDELGVPRDADQATIRKAYRTKASKAHPDKNQDDPTAKSRFQKLLAAYDVLKDEGKRQRYDETGQTEEQGGQSVEEAASDLISSIFLQIAEQNSFVPQDYILETTKKIQNALQGCTSDKKNMLVQKKRVKYIIDNTAADDFIITKLETKLHEIDLRIEHATQGETVMGKALDMLSEFRYTGSVPQGPGSHYWHSDPYIS